jgi:hypothetical protein
MHQIKSIQRLFVSCRESVHTSAPTRDCIFTYIVFSPEWRWKDPTLALAPTRVYIPQLSPHCHRSFAALSPVAGRRSPPRPLQLVRRRPVQLVRRRPLQMTAQFAEGMTAQFAMSPKDCFVRPFGLWAFGPSGQFVWKYYVGLWAEQRAALALRTFAEQRLSESDEAAAGGVRRAASSAAAAERERRGGGRRRSQSSEQRRSGWAAIGAATARWAAAAHRAQEQRRASSTSRFLILQFLPSWINGSWYRLKIVGEVKIGCEVKIVSGENRCRGENSAEVKIVSGEKSLSDETGVRWK